MGKHLTVFLGAAGGKEGCGAGEGGWGGIKQNRSFRGAGECLQGGFSLRKKPLGGVGFDQRQL